MKNNLDNQYGDASDHKYKYNTDAIIRKYMMKTFKPFLKEDSFTAELGCFDGYSSQIILDNLGSYATLDIIEGSVDLAKRVKERFKGDPRVQVYCSLFEDFNKKRFPIYDQIFLVHTLEHLAHAVEELEHISTWLKPDGLLIVAVPNAYALSRQLFREQGGITKCTDITPAEREHGHHATYSSRTLKKTVKTAGLEIVSSGGIMLKPLANFQIDKALELGVIDEVYLDSLYELGFDYPEMCASIYTICRRKRGR